MSKSTTNPGKTGTPQSTAPAGQGIHAVRAQQHKTFKRFYDYKINKWYQVYSNGKPVIENGLFKDVKDDDESIVIFDMFKLNPNDSYHLSFEQQFILQVVRSLTYVFDNNQSRAFLFDYIRFLMEFIKYLSNQQDKWGKIRERVSEIYMYQRYYIVRMLDLTTKLYEDVASLGSIDTYDNAFEELKGRYLEVLHNDIRDDMLSRETADYGERYKIASMALADVALRLSESKGGRPRKRKGATKGKPTNFIDASVTDVCKLVFGEVDDKYKNLTKDIINLMMCALTDFDRAPTYSDQPLRKDLFDAEANLVDGNNWINVIITYCKKHLLTKDIVEFVTFETSNSIPHKFLDFVYQIHNIHDNGTRDYIVFALHTLKLINKKYLIDDMVSRLGISFDKYEMFNEIMTCANNTYDDIVIDSNEIGTWLNNHKLHVEACDSLVKNNTQYSPDQIPRHDDIFYKHLDEKFGKLQIDNIRPTKPSIRHSRPSIRPLSSRPIPSGQSLRHTPGVPPHPGRHPTPPGVPPTPPGVPPPSRQNKPNHRNRRFATVNAILANFHQPLTEQSPGQQLNANVPSRSAEVSLGQWATRIQGGSARQRRCRSAR